MDWSKGFTAMYYISVVDKNTWRDVDRIEITGGSIKRTSTDLRESADINCVNYTSDREQLIRVWLDAKQEGSSSHTPLFTGLATSPARDINGRVVKNKLECYSVFKIASDILLPRGWYAPAGANGGQLIKKLMSVIGAPITLAENSPGLKSAIIAENGETYLSMADKILDAIEWKMTANGRGEISIGPIDLDPVIRFDSMGNDSIEPTLSVTYDWYSCPNVYRAIYDNASAIARDDSPDNPYSTVNRGREVWMEDTSCYLNDEETLSEYAARMLKEAQRVSTTISYSRRYNPFVNVLDVVQLNYPEQDISGEFMITDQTINLGFGAKTSEEVLRV